MGRSVVWRERRYARRVTLPLPARRRLSQPLRDAAVLTRFSRESHTVPVGASAWGGQATALVRSLRAISPLTLVPFSDDFELARAWCERLLAERSRVYSLLLSLEPFTPFDSDHANRLIDLLDESITEAAEALVEGRPAAGVADLLAAEADWWAERGAELDDGSPWSAAFNMSSPPVDGFGEFRPDWVLQHYAYRNIELFQLTLPHLQSLGVPLIGDPLAEVSIIGWILSGDDAVRAYIAMRMFIDRYSAAELALSSRILSDLGAAEPALRRSREAIGRAWATAMSLGESDETRATAMADAYKRMLEGPLKQFSWAVHCLRQGEWSAPPTLSELRERIVAAGGVLGSIIGDVVLTNVRNSEAHETLVWDGFTNEFVTERGRVPALQVGLALVSADAFARGCEAGFAAAWALHLLDDTPTLPAPNDLGRMPSWRRVRAFFGTNRLRLLDAQLNTRDALLRVERLAVTDVNPCFQALILARRLMPEIRTFSVSTPESDGPLIVVTAEALDAAMPIWELAVSSLDRMPLSAFLPVNLNARLKSEDFQTATRSVAWIAVDDAVGIVDGSAAFWGETALNLMDTRLRVVETAVGQTLLCVPQPNRRLESVLRSVSELRNLISEQRPSSPDSIEREPALERLRVQWEQWGPVRRHPSIPEGYAPDSSEAQPRLKDPPKSARYTSL